MDPLSVIGSITGILTVATTIMAALTDFVGKEKDAPKSSRNILTEVFHLKLCLDRLRPFIEGAVGSNHSRREVISVEQVVVISTSCVLTMSELGKLLDSFKLDQPMSTITRLRWARHEPRIRQLIEQIRVEKGSLGLILTILSCESLDEIQRLVGSLTDSVQTLLDTSNEVSERLGSMATRNFAQSRYTASSLRSLPSMREAASTITPEDDALANDSRHPEDTSSTPDGRPDTSQFGSDVELELYQSRVYSRTIRRHSMSPLPSAATSAPGWSFFSGISLAQVSNLSIISLPVSCHELWNSQHYRATRNSDVRNACLSEVNIDPPATHDQKDLSSKLSAAKSTTKTDVERFQMIKSRRPRAKILLLGMISQALILTIWIIRRQQMMIHYLGTSDTGKTTVSQQMEMMFPQLSMEDRFKTKDWKKSSEKLLEQRFGKSGGKTRWQPERPLEKANEPLYSQTLDSIRMLITQMETFSVPYERDASYRHANVIQRASRDQGFGTLRSLKSVAAMREFWMDENVQWLFAMKCRYGMDDDVQKFFHSAVMSSSDSESLRDLLTSPEHPANDPGIFAESLAMVQETRARKSRFQGSLALESTFDDEGNSPAYIPTLGFYPTLCDIDEICYEIIDVGGAKGERKKWVYHYQGADCVVFMVSLSEERISSYEEISRLTTFRESMELFESTVSSEKLQNCSITLLLNKVDLFESDLHHTIDVESALDTIANKFLSLKCAKNRTIDICHVDARDTRQIRPALRKIRDRIAEQQLQALLNGDMDEWESSSHKPQHENSRFPYPQGYSPSSRCGDHQSDIEYGSSSAVISSEGGEWSSDNEEEYVIKVVQEVEIKREINPNYGRSFIMISSDNDEVSGNVQQMDAKQIRVTHDIDVTWEVA